MVEIAYLADHPEAISTLVDWFRRQWPEYYAERTSGEIAEDFHEDVNRFSIPVRLLAFTGGELAGTICLREYAMSDLPEYNPGLGGLFVVEHHRRQGIGAALVRAGMALAWELGYKRLYTTTEAAKGIVLRLGWTLVRRFSHGDEELGLYVCEPGR